MDSIVIIVAFVFGLLILFVLNKFLKTVDKIAASAERSAKAAEQVRNLATGQLNVMIESYRVATLTCETLRKRSAASAAKSGKDFPFIDEADDYLPVDELIRRSKVS